MPFGIVSAPAILTNIVVKLVDKLLPLSRDIMLNSVYMDDVLAGCNDEVNLSTSIIECKNLFEQSGFKLLKIITNSPKIGELLSADVAVRKVLGINWNMLTDEFWLDWKLDIEIKTKRDLLAYIEKCFDPLGLGIVDPVKLKFRLLFAKTAKLDWDDNLDQDTLDSIGVLASDMNMIQDIHFRRIVDTTADLNCFCDASDYGYGYVVYVGDDIVFGKSKLAPKSKTIVDLELLAMYEAVMATSKIIGHLKFKGIVRILSVSQINIQRLAKSPNDHSIHVARRLLKILTIGFEHKMEFRHIAGNLNPADIYSRGCSLSIFVEKECWLIDNKDLISKSDNPIPTKLICSVVRKTDSTLVSWLRSLKTTDKMARFVDQILKWKEKACGSARRHDTFTLLCVAFQRAEESQPERWFNEDSVVRFVSRHVISTTILFGFQNVQF